MKLSVIIPTYRRAKSLLRALGSLQEQTLSEFEIIVVDNAVEREVANLISKLNCRAAHPMRYVPEPKIGLHNARHAGARAASGDILVFTDDDATFSSGWLEGYQKAFSEHPEMAAAGGPIKPVWETPPPKWLINYVNRYLQNTGHFGFFSLMEPFESFTLSRYHTFFWGTNMAIRRDILFQVGGFNPEAQGEIWIGDGESGLEAKLRAQKVLIGYVPKSLVYHHIPKKRMTAAYLCRRVANQGGCTEYAYFHEQGFVSWRLAFRFLKILGAWARDFAKMPFRALVRKNRYAWLEIRMQSAYHLFRIKYMLRLFSDRKFRALVKRKRWL